MLLLLTTGWTRNHTIPDLISPLTLTAVPAEPHRSPLTYQVCCIRVSSESGDEMTSSCSGSSTNSSCQHPGPNWVGIVVSLTHWPSGKSPACWFCRGGNTYVLLLISRLRMLSAGVAELSDDVLVSAQ